MAKASYSDLNYVGIAERHDRCLKWPGIVSTVALTQLNGTTLIVAHDVERVLADIDTNHGNCSVQRLGHGVLYSH
jgi:hypothetical protein